MQAKIKSNAGELYYNRCIHQHQTPSNHFYELLLMIEGTTVKIDTNHIFSNQYNTYPIDGVSESGIRIRWIDIEGEIDFQGDNELAEIVGKMQKGEIQCHHYKGDVKEFVDLREGNSSKGNNGKGVYVPHVGIVRG